MKRFTLWLFWNIAYQFRRTPPTVSLYCRRIVRRRWPWRKWKPSMYHNDDGNQWEVWFTDEPAYADETQLIGGRKCKAMIGQETGDVVGMIVYDETLIAQHETNT